MATGLGIGSKGDFVFGTRTASPIGDLVARYDLSACGGTADEATAETIVR